MIVHQISRNVQRRKVAAYARVSTLSELQEESYETQISYHTNLIKQTKGWSFIRMYADHGITGTSAEKRPAFMQMIQDALNGKIDLIICKSISRFFRNFREAQKYVHELKAANVEVWFIKEGIHSFDANMDLIFGAIAAVAQEESRSISENVKWTYRQLAERGIRHLGSNRILGYDEINGKLTPNSDAWIIKLVFEEYAAGETPKTILEHLKERGAHRLRSGKDFSWPVLDYILNNEVHVGDRLLQKAAPLDYLTKRPDETQAYESRYLYYDHEGIVSPEVWKAVQERLARRDEEKDSGIYIRSTSHFLYGKVFCGMCGEVYRRCTGKNKMQSYKIWRCRGRMKSSGCCGRHILEQELLSEIRRRIGWRDTDEKLFLNDVNKITVRKEGISIQLFKRKSREANLTFNI